MRPPVRRRGAFTALESLMAAGIVLMVLVAAYQLLSRVFGASDTSAAAQSIDVLLRGELRLAYQKLIDRVEDGIEIVRPGPGQSGPELEFQDLLNHRTLLRLTDRQELASSRVEAGGQKPDVIEEAIGPGGEKSILARPVKIRGCRGVWFEVLSPTLVTIYLTVSDGRRSGTLVATTRLRNARLADE